MTKKKKKPQEPEPIEIEDSQVGTEEQVAEAADPLAAAQAQCEDLLSRLQRVSADYMNYQKRAQRDLEQAREFANDQLIKSLLPVLDDMERALAAAKENHGADDPLFMGMQMVHDQALATLGQFGLSVIEAAGKEFDPDRHVAVMQSPSAEHPHHTVLEVVQKGYELKGRTIRAAGVVVSTAPDETEKDESTNRQEDDADADV